MHLPLEEYQERTLETLTEYYQKCLRLQNANTAFYDLTERPYAAVDGLPGMPYICLRLPTGGGKTFVACHAVGITASELLKTESPIVLWLVPSNAIRDQTLNALKNPNHPYRDAFESARHRVEVRTISEALYLSPHILNTKRQLLSPRCKRSALKILMVAKFMNLCRRHSAKNRNRSIVLTPSLHPKTL